MLKFDADTLPEEVKAAHQRAEAWIQERFKGRRIMPKPAVIRIAVPEEGDGAALYAIIVPPGGEARQRLDRAVMAAATAKEHRGSDALLAALEAADDLALVECCLWVQGMSPKDGQDPRVAARDQLKALRAEAGSLGAAYGLVAQAIAKLMQAPEVALGKL